MNRLKRLISSRVFKVACLIVIQALVLYMFIFVAVQFNAHTIIISIIVSLVVLVYVINRNDNTSYKLLWTIIILGLPFVGGATYLLFGGKKIPKALTRQIVKSLDESNILMINDDKEIDIDKDLEHEIAVQFKNIKQGAYFPYYKNTDSQYYASGEDIYPVMLKDIKNAQHFIMLEFFIIDAGIMWGSILGELRIKIAEGVRVYMMYDDAGCVSTLPYKYYERMRQMGINCVVFNPINARLEMQMNHRDHRKILAIDNKIAYMGGFNLADEYINKIERFGYWKDTGIRIEGEAVWNCTVMFIQFYNAIAKNEHLDYLDFKLPNNHIQNNNYVLPFSDSPTDAENIGRTTHLNMINKAKHYIYIHTPYLIIDQGIMESLMLASKNGVEVIITTPHIPDKPYAFAVTRSNYQQLILSGVKIYEFTPGFMHSKVFVSDDSVALIGTINTDYRSYYLHYECGMLITDPNTIADIVDDYIKTLNKSELITIEFCKNTNIIVRLYRAILNVFAPLM